MKKIFAGTRWREAGARIAERDQLFVHALAERTAERFCVELRRLPSLPQGIVYVFAGPGNNGADGLSIARRLLQDGKRVHCYLFRLDKELSEACAVQRDKLADTDPQALTEVTSQFATPLLDQHSVVIDALFGTGLNRPLEGGFAQLVQFINRSQATIISVDVPSGLYDEDNGENNLQGIITAHYTFACETPKVSLLLADSAPYAGTLRVLPMGLDYDSDPALETPYFLYTEQDAVSSLRRIPRFAHKGTQGHALVIAGSEGMAGSALFVAMGALRSGAGKVTLHLPKGLTSTAQMLVPEAVVEQDPHDAVVTSLPKDLTRYSSIAIGPGMGTAPASVKMFEQLLQNIPPHCPIVIDADALNIIALHPELLTVLPENSIITPHPAEFDRIANSSIDAFHRLTKARDLAVEQQIIVLLKGAYSATCLPDGSVLFNSSGSPALATAGSGDTLTGIIASLLAQGYAPASAAPLAAYVHGLTAGLYTAKQSGRGMMARDVAELLPSAFRQIEQRQ